MINIFEIEIVISLEVIKVRLFSYERDSSSTKDVMKVLNVAEKNDAAKRISAIMSKGTAQTVGWWIIRVKRSKVYVT
jgi:hypothetical protein